MIKIGFVLLLLGGIGSLGAAFKEGWVWGLGCLVCPLMFLPFLVLHWSRAWLPVMLSMLGVGTIVVFGSGGT
ncbi:hypothetical protein [Marinobacterium weihaiense]|uniref:Mercuric ion transport protein n=1 Tax=Marinobacterium weihaiense TaxID=2851016 RepID=A0ABS6MBL5_9GAMM|nr:hypothetical protein [Marinobacterium weihaiense]MBV0933683.1 hypothetical protein [Marinobacterium weihaiense]